MKEVKLTWKKVIAFIIHYSSLKYYLPQINQFYLGQYDQAKDYYNTVANNVTSYERSRQKQTTYYKNAERY